MASDGRLFQSMNFTHKKKMERLEWLIYYDLQAKQLKYKGSTNRRLGAGERERLMSSDEVDEGKSHSCIT